jgi:hypothetical protein
MNLLIQFLLRLSFGLAAGMAITSSKRVTSGYFRNNLYVMLGLTTLAALVSYYLPKAPDLVGQRAQLAAFWFGIAAAISSYIGSIFWLYEKRDLGWLVLICVTGFSLCGLTANNKTTQMELFRTPTVLNRYVDFPDRTDRTADGTTQFKQARDELDMIEHRSTILRKSSEISSGLILGMTMAAMLLGHWYLNSPTMELVPLRRLIIAMGVAVGLQAIVSALGLWGEFTYANSLSTQWLLFVLLRWLFGIIGVGVLTWMAWQTLKIPNTQSATGILYVAVIGTFVGETMALLLSAESLFPL